MTPRELIAAFDVVADAPDGVKRLRELVLSLAVRGRLVGPDAESESAQQLLLRIGLQRKALSLKPQRRVDAAEAPYTIPPNWTWVRFGDIFECRLGKMLDKAKNTGDPHPYLRNANVRWGGFDLADVLEMRLEPEEVSEVSVQRGDLVVCEGGEPGRCAVWDHEVPFVIQKALHRARPLLVDSRYYQLHLRIDCSNGRLAELFTGATIKHLTGQMLDRHLVALPPLAEQHRIVARVDELMALLDRLESAHKARDEARRAARDAALAALRDAEDPDAVETAWARIAEQMEELFTEPEDVGLLRQLVLALAVRGSLVEQDESDGDAATLVRRSDAESRQASNERWPLPHALSGHLPRIPDSWCWVALGTLLTDVQAGWSPAALARPKEQDEWGVLKVSACSWGQFLPDENKALYPGTQPRPDLEVRDGDLLISRANTAELVARSVVVTASPRRLILSDKTLRLVPVSSVNARYLNIANLSPLARAHYVANATGTSDSMKNVSQAAIRETPIPLPPLPEQHRIVAKVDALMALCDALEARLRDAHALHAQLAAAAVHHLDA